MSKLCSLSAYCAWYIALLTSPCAVLFHTCLCFCGEMSQFQFTSAFSLVALTCAKLALREVVMAFHRLSLLLRLKVIAYIFSIVLVWCSSDLFSVSLYITGYVSLHNQLLLHITLSKPAFTSHCVYFHYIVICPVSSAYTIGVISFAWSWWICCGLWTGHYFSYFVYCIVC